MPASISADASMMRSRQSRARLPSRPLQLPQRLAALAIRVGVNEIVEALGLGEIELAVLERAARELARLGRARIRNSEIAARSAASTARPPWTWNSATSSPVAARRPRKPEHDRVVDRLAGTVPKQPAAGLPRRRQLACERHQHQAGLRTRDTHHGDRARRTAGRQRKDGLVSRMHGLFVRLAGKRQTALSRAAGSHFAAFQPAAITILHAI